MEIITPTPAYICGVWSLFRKRGVNRFAYPFGPPNWSEISRWPRAEQDQYERGYMDAEAGRISIVDDDL